MMRDTWFWEVEVVRLEDGEQLAPSKRLDFSIRPLNYLFGSMAAAGLAAAVLFALVFVGPGDYHPRDLGTHCVWGNPGPYYEEPLQGCCFRYYAPAPRGGTGADVVTPLRAGNDTTLLVRRIP